MKARTAKETLSITTKVVLPNDTNTQGNLFGGELLAWMDVISSVAAHRHCKRVVVTASVNNVSFQQPIPHASVVTLEAKVSRAFNSSMEVFIDVFVENTDGSRRKCNEAIYNFGKHKGKTIKEISVSEPGYYGWMLEADFPRYTKKVLKELVNSYKLKKKFEN